MKRITAFLIGLAFATAGGVGTATADDFPLPLPTVVTSINQVVGFVEQSFSLVDNNATLTSLDFTVLNGTGSFVAWFENPTIDADGTSFTDTLTSVIWEVFEAGGGLLATGGLSSNNVTPFFFSGNPAAIKFVIRNFNGSGNTTGDFNIGLAVAVIPEPATWIMMILGFGLIGLQMRRQAKTRVEMA